MSNPKPSAAPDWSCQLLKKAAVEYLVQQIGTCPARGKEAYFEKLKLQAKVLSAPSADDLLKWVTDAALLPDLADRRFSSAVDYVGPDSRAIAISEDPDAVDEEMNRRASLPDLPPGGVPALQPDPLSMLLRDEEDTLSLQERERLAEVIETGSPLSRSQSAALVCLLRGADLAGRRETVRAVLDWLVPESKSIGEIWERRETRITAPLGSTYTYQDEAHVLPGWQLIGRSRLIVAGPSGNPVAVRSYCRVICQSQSSRSEEFRVRYLCPTPRFAKDHVLHQFALLASLVREDGRSGQEWASLFGSKSGKQIVSYHKKNLAAKINQSSGGTSGFRSLRNKKDPRKGTTLNEPMP